MIIHCLALSRGRQNCILVTLRIKVRKSHMLTPARKSVPLVSRTGNFAASKITWLQKCKTDFESTARIITAP